jgi:hypothetical protein
VVPARGIQSGLCGNPGCITAGPVGAPAGGTPRAAGTPEPNTTTVQDVGIRGDALDDPLQVRARRQAGAAIEELAEAMLGEMSIGDRRI